MTDPIRPAGIRCYTSSTLEGNWYEDRLREDEARSEIRRTEGGLLGTLLRITAPAKPILASPGKITDGDSLLVVNHYNSARSLCTDPRFPLRGAAGALPLTVSPRPRLVVRSLFTVRVLGGGELVYGGLFTLSPHPSVAQGLVLATWPRSPELQPRTRDAQSAGFEPCDPDNVFIPTHTFRAEYPDPAVRLEMEGLSIRPGDLLVIRHAQTGRTLMGTDNPVVSDIAPRELEVVCGMALDQYRRETQPAIWSLEAPGLEAPASSE